MDAMKDKPGETKDRLFRVPRLEHTEGKRQKNVDDSEIRMLTPSTLRVSRTGEGVGRRKHLRGECLGPCHSWRRHVSAGPRTSVDSKETDTKELWTKLKPRPRHREIFPDSQS